jgi:hypothetical protein
MNSWHAWSPNSKWVVFASKAFGAYTDMFLTHIDSKGNSSIPILIDKARAGDKVSNYPEFVNRKPGAAFVMEYDYVELAHIRRTLKAGNIEKAKELFHKLESQNPFFFAEDCLELSEMLNNMGLTEDAKRYTELSKSTINSTIFNTKK